MGVPPKAFDGPDAVNISGITLTAVALLLLRYMLQADRRSKAAVT